MCSDNADFKTRLEAAQEQISFQKEQILSSEGFLKQSQESADQLQQELYHSNEDGALLNRENQLLTAGRLLSLQQAQSLAKRALAEKKTAVEALAWLLSEIYGHPVSPSDIESHQAHELAMPLDRDTSA